MTHSQHTPGPWHVELDVEGHARHIMCNAWTVAEASIHADGKNNAELLAQSEANARLIAAAPELVEALRDCMFALGRGGANVINGPNRAEWEAARALLSRIEGGKS